MFVVAKNIRYVFAEVVAAIAGHWAALMGVGLTYYKCHFTA